MKKERVYGLDFFRGIAIIIMVIYHVLFSLVYVYGVDLEWFKSPYFNNIGAPLIGGTFTLISGISTRYSRSVLKRGLQIFLWGMVMTVVTAVAVPDLIIMFGILHLMGSCMIIAALTQKYLDKIPIKIGLGVSLLLFMLTYQIPRTYFGIKNPYLFPFGLLTNNFYSSDYYPIIPWIFLFIAGTYLGIYVKEGKAPKFLYKSHSELIETIGRHTLWVYVLHQPIIVAVFWLLLRMFA